MFSKQKDIGIPDYKVQMWMIDLRGVQTRQLQRHNRKGLIAFIKKYRLGCTYDFIVALQTVWDDK